MPKINILNILSGDNQSTIVDKINYNFDQILSSGGGPQGQQGLIGATGPVGPQGVPGIQGAKGDKGNQWFVTPTAPSSPALGDFWLDVDSPDQTILEYKSTGWVTTGYGLSSGDIFQKMNYIRGGGSNIDDRTAVVLGGVGNGQGSNAFTSLVLSDVPINTVGSIGGYAPGTPPELFIRNVNQENSKLKITTDQRSNLISFSKGSLDLLSPGLNGVNNPTISWDSPSVTLRPYDISFKNPTGGISILTEGSLRGPIVIKSSSDGIRIESNGVAQGGINVTSTKEVTVKSNSENISIFTAGATKGSFIRFNPDTGFSEFNDDITGAINANSPSLFVNSKGVGIGVGRKTNYTFKQTGADPRKLAVLGNVSISKQGFDHESVNMFIGAASTDTIDYDKGALLVRGYGAFGHNHPSYDLGSGLITTGPSELANNFPKLFVAGSRRGQTFQVKTGSSSGFISRTTIGDGFNDYNAVTDKTSAGYGPDLTQEFFVDTYNFSAAPLISLQHKITNSTNVTDTATVFSISTFTKAGTYNPDTIATKTFIQTKNSNSELRIYANATSSANSIYNKVIIGARDKSLIGVFAGQDSSNVGTVTIGQNAISNKSALNGIFDAARITFPSNDTNNHSLSVIGVQTIGTSDPYSSFGYNGGTVSNWFGVDSSRTVGTVSMLKIQRGTLNSSNNSTGYIYDNYANGLEIISYRANTNNPITTANKSVGIIVASSTSKYNIPTTGFFVSDDGKNAAINSFIDYRIGLKINQGLWNPTYSNTNINTYPMGLYVNGRVVLDGTVEISRYSGSGGLVIHEGSANNDDLAMTIQRQFQIDVNGNDYTINATYYSTAIPQINLQTGNRNRLTITEGSMQVQKGVRDKPGIGFGLTNTGGYSQYASRNGIYSPEKDQGAYNVGSAGDGSNLGFVVNDNGTPREVIRVMGKGASIGGIQMIFSADVANVAPQGFDRFIFDSGISMFGDGAGIGSNITYGNRANGAYGQGDGWRCSWANNTSKNHGFNFATTQSWDGVQITRLVVSTPYLSLGQNIPSGGLVQAFAVMNRPQYDSRYGEIGQVSFEKAPIIPSEQVTAASKRLVIRKASSLTSDNGIAFSDVNATAGSISDRRLKKNIKSIVYNGEINKLNPVTFDWKDNDGQCVKGKNIGLIAQEVLEVIPQGAIWGDADNDEEYLNIHWASVISLLIAESKSKDNVIKDLISRIEKIESKLND